MDVSTILNNGLFQKISTHPHGCHWKSFKNAGFLLGFFQEDAAKNFVEGIPSKFSGANDSGGGANFFNENKIFTLES